jgi:hypothetical protein
VPRLAVIAGCVVLLLPAPGQARRPCAEAEQLSIGDCTRCLDDATQPAERRLRLVARLRQLAADKRAQEALAARAFDGDARVQRAVLEALAARGRLKRAAVKRVPRAPVLLSRIRQQLEVTAAQRRAARVQLVNAPDCTAIGKARRVPGGTRIVGAKRGMTGTPVACSSGVLGALRPGDCRLRGSRGAAVRIRCITTLCGGACQVYRLVTEVVTGRRWRVSALLLPVGDTGECGCCTAID